jgi:Holliday junction resolvase
MNNKKLGTEFEREVVKLLSQKGYWVHFITPDARGSQPFDIIASRNDSPFVIDCKTSATKWFNISRLEDNQIMAFELWLKKGNKYAFVVIKYNGKIYCIPYRMLQGLKRMNLEDFGNFELCEYL